MWQSVLREMISITLRHSPMAAVAAVQICFAWRCPGSVSWHVRTRHSAVSHSSMSSSLWCQEPCVSEKPAAHHHRSFPPCDSMPACATSGLLPFYKSRLASSRRAAGLTQNQERRSSNEIRKVILLVWLHGGTPFWNGYFPLRLRRWQFLLRRPRT